MKKIMLSSLLAINLLYGNNIALDQNIKDKIIILDNTQSYQTARELLSEFITKDNTVNALNFWLNEDKKILDTMNFYKNSITNINFKIQNNKRHVASGLTVLAYISYKGINTYANKENQEHILKNYYIPLYDINQAKKILKKFDILKKSEQKLNYILKNYIKQTDIQEFKKSISLLKKVKNFKNEIKTNRTNFISYTVVSPYLANAQRYIMLANLDDLIGHNEKYLQYAAKSMAKGAYKNILLESNEDVREQFYNVFQQLKETAGDKELEDLKVLQTLMDTSSNAKKTGADKWWD